MLTATEAPTGPAPEQETRPSPSLADVLIRTVSYALLFLMFLQMSIKMARPLRDPDTWWHLRLGEEFSNGWSLGDPGRMSPFAERPWVATQWLLEVGASKLEAWFGLPGVVWLSGAGVLAVAAAVFFACRRVSDALPASLCTMVALAGASASLSPRPQTASFFFLALTVWAWMGSAQDLRPRWWLAALTWVWACSHGMWFLGPLVGFAAVGGLVVDSRGRTRPLVRLAAVPVVSLVAAALTPVGPKLLLVPVQTRGASQQYIDEWGPPSFTDLAPAMTAAMIGVIVVLWARRTGGVPWYQITLVGLAVGWTLLSYRTVALGAVIAAPLLAGTLQTSMRRPARPVPGREGLLVSAMLVVSLGALASASAPLTRPSVEDFPVALDRKLEALPDDTIVFNDYFLGGWLEWRHRNVVPVVDGMTHAYYDEWVEDYVLTTRLAGGWEDFLTDTGAQYALIPTTSALAVELRSHLKWSDVARDDMAGYVLLEAPRA